ncbi:hypothetical protein AZF37_06070 [endosymbiont 'TC1' of Trimyema compressum]|nr:hypothetical protein AZF37_06070 [endosymbiont 'TC1' of Trimyema compressum]
MSRLLLGVSPECLAKVPYRGVFKYPPLVRAESLHVNIHPKGLLRIAPCIAGQKVVGGDTVAAVLDTQFLKNKDINLLVDIGTNGEIVLGSKKVGFLTTSAAGPAFEGAEILWGMRGIKGAIEKVFVENNRLNVSVIGETAPEGICGSGLVDAIAVMLKEGVLSKGSSLIKAEEATFLKEDIRRRITDQGFVLSFPEENKLGEAIYISKNDVRQMQLAKAGILAAITLLKETLGVKGKEIQSVVLAGAFGSYIDKNSAITIGLFPKSVKAEQIKIAGNSAGLGARKLLFTEGVLEGEKNCQKNKFLRYCNEKRLSRSFYEGNSISLK